MKFLLKLILLAALAYAGWWLWKNYDVGAWLKNCQNAPRARKTAECIKPPQKRLAPISDDEKTVFIKNCAFAPQNAEIPKDGRIIWINEDKVDRQIISRSFDSGLINPGKQYQRMFKETGTYNYYCADQEKNTGAIVVK